ncbi:toprim domain-containing protein [Nocardioides sp. SOB44]|uniref:Toprim domain-containing protein n=1 Tax=Nocardioides cremeus TaxID=3058044 RepID=A0ABT8TW55_9ACTN|nr:toprim domain-containing protein [Nocardioides cremeus]MDO3398096.1 toprim domain-containing protein [Nocardioides cremeus]
MSGLVGDYIYTDELGRPVLRKLRSEPKRFKMAAALHRHDRLYWKSGPRCVERYQADWAMKAMLNLPCLLDALRRGEPVFLTEGERDCQTLSSLQKVAVTTNWQGAGEFTRQQAGWFVYGGGRSQVTIFLDRDDAGHWAAWQRYSLLTEVGVAPERITMLRPAATRHKDLTDVAQEGLLPDAFRRVSPRLARHRAEAYGAVRAARYAFEWTPEVVS